MTQYTIPFTRQTLDHFAKKEWTKALAYMQKQFNLPVEDCKDIFQESFITLYDNIIGGDKLKNLNSSLSTYFIAICRNKAHELLRTRGVYIDPSDIDILTDNYIAENRMTALISICDNNQQDIERKEALVRQIVRNLPEPCNSLLWGFYRDNLSLKTLAQMYNYSTGSVKVVKHRCMEKFRNLYRQLANKLV